MNIENILIEGTNTLKQSGVSNPQLDCEILLSNSINEDKKYIIPELLRANQPELDWDHEDNLRFKYQYYFMPAGIISVTMSLYRPCGT